jgi:hypothetical protein
VRTCDNLHAKVWLTEAGVIIGSSNASTNGLDLEGKEASSLIEANLFTDEQPTLTTISKWFDDEVWRKARTITANDLKRAREKRRPFWPGGGGGSLLETLRSDRDAFADRDDIWVWVYRFEGTDKWFDQELGKERRQLHDDTIDAWENISRRDWHKPGDWVIEFDSSSNERPQYNGIFRVFLEDPFRRLPRNRTILFCHEKKDVDGYRLRQNEQRQLEEAAQRAVEGREEWVGTIHQFAEWISF